MTLCLKGSLRSQRCVHLLIALCLVLASAQFASAQSIVVMVNDEPITSYDVQQRQKFLALSSGLGDRLRSRLKSPDTQAQFRSYMAEQRPQSREEAKALQDKFVKKLQREVVANASTSMRKKAIDQLIEERLMLQAARAQKVDISDDDVKQAMTRMAQGGSKKATLEQFLASFHAQGINPVTLKDRIRSQLAWRDLIRRLYGPLVQSTVSAIDASPSSDEGSTVVDVEIVKLSVSGNDQKAVAGRLVEADEIRKGFSSCSDLNGKLSRRSDVSVRSVKKAKLKDFPGDARAALAKAKPGEMTPPIIKGNTVETIAVCSKKVTAPKKDKKRRARGDERQEKMELYSQRHLRDLKDRALLKYPKSG